MKNLIAFLFIAFLAGNSFGQDVGQLFDAKPFEVKGSLGGNLGLYSVSGVEDRTSPYQYGLSARLNFRFYGFSIPVYAAIRDNSFNYGSSFSRIRINPQYKWIKLHLGDAYINFNPYTLNGRTVSGYGVELTPGRLRFKFLKGKVEDLRSYVDSLQLGTVLVPTYSRNVTAVSLGFGSSAIYLDVYGVKSEDRLDSLNGEVVLEDYTRQSNTVVGSTLALRLAGNLSLRSNFGLSFQTENLDSYGDNTIVGSNGVSGNLLEGNISSKLTYAGDIGVNFTHRAFSLNGRIKYIQPYFQPLTVAFINSDVIHYTIGGSTSLFNRRVNLMANVGVQQNNLSGTKLSTSNNLIINLAANFRISKQLTGSVNFSNFTQDFQAKLIQINDLYTYAISSKVANAALRYSFDHRGLNYRISLRGGRNNFFTVSDTEEELSAYSSWNSTLTFGLGDRDKDYQINTSVSYRAYDRESSSSTNYGLRLNVKKGFADGKIKLGYTSAYILNDREGLREGYTLRNGLDASYKLNDRSNMGLVLNHIKRSSTIRVSFSEVRAGLRYYYNF